MAGPVYEPTPFSFEALAGGPRCAARDSAEERCLCCSGAGAGAGYGECPLCAGRGALDDGEGAGDRAWPLERADLLGGCDEAAFCLRSLLTQGECEDIIRQAERFGLRDCCDSGYSRRVRVSDRVCIMGEELAAVLFARARPHLADIAVRVSGRPTPRGLGRSAKQGLWRPVGLNPCFRVCRYHPGGFFLPHHDGGFKLSDEERSLKTFMLYLNDDFEGGPTNFYSESQPHYSRPVRQKLLHAYQPERGAALVFNHHLTHDGGQLLAGVKYLLRTEVMYRLQ